LLLFFITFPNVTLSTNNGQFRTLRAVKKNTFFFCHALCKAQARKKKCIFFYARACALI
jgi:hypothetical protein